MTDIAVVYDGSALLAYAHGQIGAAELISEINAEGRHVGVPSTCLAAALAALRDEWDVTQLMRLVSTGTMVILPLGADDDGKDPAEVLRQVSEFTRLAQGDLSVGHAAAAAVAHRAYYVTANPSRVTDALPPSWPVLDLSPVRLVSDRFGLVATPTGAVTPAHPGGADDEPHTTQMPTQVQPMLATLGSLPTTGEWGYEFKWDGVRAIAYVNGHDLRLTGRNNVGFTDTFPELTALSTLLAGRKAVLDGEIVALGRTGVPSYAALQQRMRARVPTATAVNASPVRFYLFDLLYLDGTDLTPQPYVERRDALQRLALTGDTVETPPYWTGDAGPALLDAARELGIEGVIAKQLASTYQPSRRSTAWIKVPLTETTEVILAGYKPGAGRRSGMIGSLLVGMYDVDGQLCYVGQVNTGLTDEISRDLMHHLEPRRRPTSPFDKPVPRQHARDAEWVRPELVAEVTYRSWTPDGRLRQPSWKGLRTDVDPTEVKRAELQ